MNMKKTIAAIAACAVAVSAMATVVSAEETREEKESHKYNLTIEKKLTNVVDSLTFTAKDVAGAVANASPDGTTFYTLDIYGYGIDFTGQTVKVTVTDKSTKTSTTFEFKTKSDAPGYDGYAETFAEDFYGVDAAGACVITDNIVNYLPSSIATGTFLTDGTMTKLPKPEGQHNRLRIKIPDNSTIYNAFVGGSARGIDITVKIDGGMFSDYNSQTDLNKALGNVKEWNGTATVTLPKKIGLAEMDAAQTNVYTTGAMAGDVKVHKPLKTNSNMSSSAYNATDIITLLETENTNGDKPYKNVKAVINDMIANYDDVTFTFTTATDNVLTPAYLSDKSWMANSILKHEDYYVTGVPKAESWMGDGNFKSFPQHLYNWYGDEGTQYTYSSSDYVFNNLFNAALVANSGYTMNQSSIQPFQYSATTVSFSWNDMTGGASFVNTAGALTRLQLMTSSDWYWDSMTVTGYAVSAEDVNAEAGVTDDGEDLDDTDDTDVADDTDVVDDTDVDDADIDDTDVDDTDVDDTDVDTDVDDTDVDDTTDAAETQSNPDTGNAPIALAVIPVALAAAAVVAKKRG